MKSFEYLQHLRVSESAERFITRLRDRVFSPPFLTQQRRWLASLHAPKIRSGAVAPIEVRAAPPFGQGAFATAPLASGDYVGTYTGDLVRRKLWGRNSNDYCFLVPTPAWSFRPLMVDAEKAGNEIRYLNHSDRPNCEAIGIPLDGLIHILILAIQPIETGQQLFLDYGKKYWKSDSRRKLLI